MESTIQTLLDSLLPPKIKLAYKDFTLISESVTQKVFEATCATTGQRHTIRLLDAESEIVKKDHNAAVTLFLQEILYLCSKIEDKTALIIERFEIHEHTIGFVMKPFYPLRLELSKQEERTKLQNDTEQIMKNLLADVKFLHTKMNSPDIALSLDNVFHLQNGNSFFIGDWGSALIRAEEEKSNKEVNEPSSKGNPLAVQEIYDLGLLLLEINGVKRQELEDLPKIKNEGMYHGALEFLAKTLNPESKQKLVKSMLTKEMANRAKLDELEVFKIIEDVPVPQNTAQLKGNFIYWFFLEVFET